MQKPTHNHSKHPLGAFGGWKKIQAGNRQITPWLQGMLLSWFHFGNLVCNAALCVQHKNTQQAGHKPGKASFQAVSTVLNLNPI